MEGINPGKKIENKERVKTIEIEIEGVKYPVECISYDFEYPKNVQEETGILGYERTKISSGVISDFAKKFYQNKYAVNIEDYGFQSIESIDEFTKANEKRMESMPKTDRGVYVDGYLKSGQFKIDEALSKLDRWVLRELAYSLSGGEYPNKCFTHEMGADHKGSKQEEYRENFKDSKFFLQKIYDLDYIKDQKDRRATKIFDMANVGGYESKSHVTVFDKQTGEKVSPGDYIQIGDLGKKEYYEGIKSGKMFACTPDSGLNVETGDIFFKHHFKLGNKNPSFGFPMDEGSFMYKYLYKSLDVYVNKLKGVDFKKFSATGSGIGAILQELILSSPEIQKDVFFAHEFTNGKVVLNSVDRDPKTVETGNNIIHEIESELGVDFDNFLENGKEKIAKRPANARAIGEYELRLPIFIGSDELPQLEWGHAKYAHYMNEKGLNFFKFKHADHLPTKTSPQQV